MWKVLDSWIQRYFANEEAVLLSLLMLASLVVVFTLSDVLAPFLAALVFAFLLQGAVTRLKRWHLPHTFAVMLVFIGFVGAFLLAVVFLMPIVIEQSANLLAEMPRMLRKWQAAVLLLPEQYPQFISEQRLAELMQYVTSESSRVAEAALSFSLSKFANLIGILVYLILVPLLVFFMLKDKDQLGRSLSELLPRERPVMNQIWLEMNLQMANYVRGKAIEILIVGASTYVSFKLLGVNYAALLGLLVGLSVVIPYIGAAVVTIPVLLIGYFQWGSSAEFFWLFVVYMTIQVLDGNVLVPLLFSEAVNLHPIAIILAVLLFGGIWGVWGLFFAIPLATLIKALYNAWPRNEDEFEAALDEAVSPDDDDQLVVELEN
ncbi:MAG: AI-2E family transporter [Porticoccaceae bacterium]